MLSHRIPASRIPSIHPLRPPSILVRHPKHLRPFTSNTQLLLASNSPGIRPQLPYLAQPFRPGPHQSPYLQGQVLRLLSTENKRYVKEQLYLAAKWNSLIVVALCLLIVIGFGYKIEEDERKNPTPDEWSWTTRQSLRAARLMSDPDPKVRGTWNVSWASVGLHFLKCLKKLEDRESAEGKDVEEVLGEGEGEILIPGVGKAGLDISAKSWPWRAGYFEVIMGCALAAEHLDSMVLDKSRGLVFPKDMMIGPSNPDPRPVPPTSKDVAPKEEDCVNPFEGPETYYLKVLTGRGFTTGQKLQAALTYANWLQFKGLNDAAYEMYRWGIDIAKEGLPPTTNPAEILDDRSYTLKESASGHTTPNLLRATTSLAIHHARTGNISSALPIFLSVLRARRTAPVDPDPPPPPTKDPFSLWNFLFVPPKFPDPPPSGNDPLLRPSSEPTCAESELMLYIGEILFTSGKEAEEGFGWTKQAVTIADAQLSKLNSSQACVDEVESKKCKECLLTGVGNWDVMLQRLLEEQKPAAGPSSSWKLWGRASGAKAEDKAEQLKEDQRKVDALRERIVKENLDGQVVKTNSGTGLWFG